MPDPSVRTGSSPGEAVHRATLQEGSLLVFLPVPKGQNKNPTSLLFLWVHLSRMFSMPGTTGGLEQAPHELVSCPSQRLHHGELSGYTGSAQVSSAWCVGCFREHQNIISPGLSQDSLNFGAGLPVATPQNSPRGSEPAALPDIITLASLLFPQSGKAGSAPLPTLRFCPEHVERSLPNLLEKNHHK